MAVIIREYQPKDIAQMTAIWNEVVEDGVAWVYWFEMPDEPVFIRVTRTRGEGESEPEPDPEFEGGGLELPAGILEIEESAFEGDRSIFVVDIPAGCRRIGKWAFRNCTSLWKIRIPNGCEVDDEAFEGCGSVYLFGPPLGTAYYYCLEHDGCGFVEE